MGLLDDAIREHLDLKRRRGADPTEVERAEREALGPVRRAPEAGPSAEPADEAEQAPGFAYDQEIEEGWTEEPGEDLPAPRARRVRPEPAPEPDFADDELDEDEPESTREAKPSRLSRLFGKSEPEADENHDEIEHLDAGDSEDLDADEVEPHAPHRPAADDTVAFHPDEVPDAPAEPESDEDVLEETPEFLQDTPDHDRLWFEQRPPRDFDLDK
jgi:hypothetical protein